MNLFDELFNTAFNHKNFDIDTATKITKMGYNSYDFDRGMSLGKITKEDLKLRIDLYDRFVQDLQKLDDELTQRNKKPAPAKLNDSFHTKTYGRIFIVNIDESKNLIDFVSERGGKYSSSFETFEKIIKY